MASSPSVSMLTVVSGIALVMCLGVLPMMGSSSSSSSSMKGNSAGAVSAAGAAQASGKNGGLSEQQMLDKLVEFFMAMVELRLSAPATSRHMAPNDPAVVPAEQSIRESCEDLVKNRKIKPTMDCGEFAGGLSRQVNELFARRLREKGH